MALTEQFQISHVSIHDRPINERRLLGLEGGGSQVVDGLAHAAAVRNVRAEIIYNYPYDIVWNPEMVRPYAEDGESVPIFYKDGNPQFMEIPFVNEALKGDPPLVLSDEGLRYRTMALLKTIFQQPERRKTTAIAHHYVAGILMTVAHKYAPVPVVYIPHSLHLFTDMNSWVKLGANRSWKSVEQEAQLSHIPFRNSDLIILPTQAEIEIITNDLLGGKSDRTIAPFLNNMRCIPWGVDHEVFNPTLQKKEYKREARRWIGLPVEADMIFGFAGRIVPVKNIETIIDAFAMTLRAEPRKNNYLVIFGGNIDDLKSQDSYMSQLYRRVQSKDMPELESRVIFAGSQPAQLVMSATDVLVQPSYYESWGLSITEAMACGIPVIVSDTPIMREVTGNTQLYGDPDNPESFAHHMITLLRNKDLLNNAGQRGILKTDQYSWDKSFQLLQEAIDSIPR